MRHGDPGGPSEAPSSPDDGGLGELFRRGEIGTPFCLPASHLVVTGSARLRGHRLRRSPAPARTSIARRYSDSSKSPNLQRSPPPSSSNRRCRLPLHRCCPIRQNPCSLLAFLTTTPVSARVSPTVCHQSRPLDAATAIRRIRA